jgi:hypothetical protein
VVFSNGRVTTAAVAAVEEAARRQMSLYRLGAYHAQGDCIGARIEAEGDPKRCRWWMAGDSSGCHTCGARWDTNDFEEHLCGLQGAVDPIRGGLIT